MGLPFLFHSIAFIICIIQGKVKEVADILGIGFIMLIYTAIAYGCIKTGVDTYKLKKSIKNGTIRIAALILLITFSIYAISMASKYRETFRGLSSRPNITLAALSLLILIYAIWSIAYINMKKIKEKLIN